MRILHVAPQNIAGVPISLVRAERALGHESRLITLFRDRRRYEEDICLELPFIDFWGTRLVKRLVSAREKRVVHNRLGPVTERPPVWRPKGPAERFLVHLRERLWRKAVVKATSNIDFWKFDVYQLDGGLEFFRDGRTVRRLKALGKTVVCCYTGSDLRTRGVLPVVDALADLNLTFEFDHLVLHPNIVHVAFPLEVDRFTPRRARSDGLVRIGHAPTNRHAKGSATILRVVRELERHHPVQLVLIENLPHAEALRRKAECDIFIDQIGDLGYGINGLEALAMGIATCSCLASGFARRYPDHPLIEVNERDLAPALIELIRRPEWRRRKGEEGRRWVERHHDSRKVVARIHELIDRRRGERTESRSTTLSD